MSILCFRRQIGAVIIMEAAAEVIIGAETQVEVGILAAEAEEDKMARDL